MRTREELRVAVLMGGVSNEREISLKSGREVVEALAGYGHEVHPVDVTERDVDALDDLAPDVAFIALHGEFGEDGHVQGQLEEKGIPYTGSGPAASRAGMNKLAAKRAFIRHSVPTPDYLVVASPAQADIAAQQAERLGRPVVCKPIEGGSSIGVSVCHSEDEIGQGICRAFECGNGAVLVERYVAGREMTVSVLDGAALPVVEIRTRRSFFNYEAKYLDDDTLYDLEVPIARKERARIRETGVLAYHALGCRHMGRTDLICGEDGRLYVLEVNTIPGCTSRSLLPMAAAAAGINFPQLCDRLVCMARRDAALPGTSAAA